eukprot:2302407-Pleurochrysis_carterae.AAC.1
MSSSERFLSRERGGDEARQLDGESVKKTPAKCEGRDNGRRWEKPGMAAEENVKGEIVKAVEQVERKREGGKAASMDTATEEE